MYTTIFAGVTIGLALDVTVGDHAFSKDASILLILVPLTLAGCTLLAGYAYIYYIAAKLQLQKKRARRPPDSISS